MVTAYEKQRAVQEQIASERITVLDYGKKAVFRSDSASHWSIVFKMTLYSVQYKKCNFNFAGKCVTLMDNANGISTNDIVLCRYSRQNTK